MSTKGYEQLAQGPDHDLSLATEQEGQSNEYGHGAERTSSSSTDSTNPVNGQSDPCTTTNADPTTTTNSGTMLSFETDLGEPLVVETRMDRFRRTLLNKKRTLLVGCAAVLLGIVMLSLTVMKFKRHQQITLSLRENLAHLVQSQLASISFDSPTSPESKALDWMVNVDKLNHTAVSDDRLVQRFAVAAMAYSMCVDGESGMLTSESVCNWRLWSSPTSPCNNDGVVNGIMYNDMYEWNDCFLPASIGLLTGLTTLNFDGNECAGTIPTEIGLLTGLTTLDISDDYLSGSIPTEIGLLTGLTTLYLSAGSVTGTIPSKIRLLTNLTTLDIAYNHFSGSVPTEIGLLTSLATLSLETNDLTGSIPTEIGLLTGLSALDISGNHLTGAIPTEIGLLTSLTSLDLVRNKFTGSIPIEIGLLTSLIEVHFGTNDLTGFIPTHLCDHPHTFFQIDCDKITCSCCKDIKWNPCPAN